MPSRGQTITLTYTAWDFVNNVPKTGDVANHTLRWVKDGTASAPTNAAAELDATNAPGEYKLVLTATECTANAGKLVGKSSTSGVYIVPCAVTFEQLPTAAPGASTGLPQIGVSPLTLLDAAITTRLATAGYTVPPTGAANATAVRSELSVELGRIDATITSRLATASYTTPPTVVAIRTEMDSNSTKLANLDAAVTTRQATVTFPTNFALLGINGDGEVDAVGGTVSVSGQDIADAMNIAPSTGNAYAGSVHAKLDAIPSLDVETDIAAIKAKTDNLPTDPAGVSDVEAVGTAVTALGAAVNDPSNFPANFPLMVIDEDGKVAAQSTAIVATLNEFAGDAAAQLDAIQAKTDLLTAEATTTTLARKVGEVTLVRGVSHTNTTATSVYFNKGADDEGWPSDLVTGEYTLAFSVKPANSDPVNIGTGTVVSASQVRFDYTTANTSTLNYGLGAHTYQVWATKTDHAYMLERGDVILVKNEKA
jgi:hypothetical protein